MNKIQYLYAAYAGILESNPHIILEDIMLGSVQQREQYAIRLSSSFDRGHFEGIKETIEKL